MANPVPENARQVANALKVHDLPQEHDSLWSIPDPGGRPSGPAHFRDLPIIGGHRAIEECVDSAFSALVTQSLGNFQAVGYLLDSMGADDRISAVTQTRLDALASLPLATRTRISSSRAQKRAEQLVEEWPEWVADSELRRIHQQGIFLGLGIGEIIWNADGTSPGGVPYWSPRVKFWDARNAWYRHDTRSFWITSWDGILELTPGDGHWIIYTPYGLTRGWMHSLIRPLVAPFLRRSFGYRDWGRFSEIHGIPIKKLYTPSESAPGEREQVRDAIRSMGAEGLVVLKRGIDANSGWDMSLEEASSQSWQGFDKQTERDEMNIAVTVLGANLGTSAKSGGSYALGSVQERIRIDRLEADASSLGHCMSEQLVVPWAIYNFGDRRLAPHVTWSTKAPEDRAKRATTLRDAGTALGLLRAGGLNVDREEFAKIFEIKLDEREPLCEPEPVVAAPVSSAPERVPDGEEEKNQKEDLTPDEEPDTENQD